MAKANGTQLSAPRRQAFEALKSRQVKKHFSPVLNSLTVLFTAPTKMYCCVP
ncbi:hypothetical protein Niako_3457 [Niastella koreensis GR20-10]|uniref:Uncharacterized protein n=1 Tax=Niastella koreensis (strain DSM 17620 / KACC 11465 / NBRC 106392 / GR20-10) TaxID=700598 RepID=G8TKT2_NIAKG|nr:hypothetical protein [Niastella koreensis]AEV99761.1 hypothetical protein Niako_3457 [Niastella koreensis GR20-10]